MAVKTRDELLSSIRTRLGDDTSDEALALIEDMSDTLIDYEQRANGDGIDWKSRYEENDTQWRNKYRDRFFNTGTDDNEIRDEPDSKKSLKFEDLFEEKE